MCLLSAGDCDKLYCDPHTLRYKTLYMYFIMCGPFIKIAIDAPESHFLCRCFVVKNNEGHMRKNAVNGLFFDVIIEESLGGGRRWPFGRKIALC